MNHCDRKFLFVQSTTKNFHFWFMRNMMTTNRKIFSRRYITLTKDWIRSFLRLIWPKSKVKRKKKGSKRQKNSRNQNFNSILISLNDVEISKDISKVKERIRLTNRMAQDLLLVNRSTPPPPQVCLHLIPKTPLFLTMIISRKIKLECSCRKTRL